MIESGTSEEERAFDPEDGGIEWRHEPARESEQHQIPAVPKTVQAFVERVLAHRVVHHLDAFPVRQPLHFLLEIVGRVVDHFVGTRLAREFHFGIRAGGGDDACADEPRDLRQHHADSTSRRMNERGFARLQGIGAVRQVVRGEPLEHRAGSGPQIQVVR